MLTKLVDLVQQLMHCVCICDSLYAQTINFEPK